MIGQHHLALPIVCLNITQQEPWLAKHYLPEILDKILGDIFLCLRKASFDQKWNVIGLLFPEIEVLGIYEIPRKSLKYLELKASALLAKQNVYYNSYAKNCKNQLQDFKT